MPIIYGLLAFWFGAIIGSFLNVVVWRMPRGESLSYPPSHCPKCGHRIRPWENIPIISWLCLGARCSSCHLPISWKYPVGEAAVGLLYLAIAWRVYLAGLPFDTLAGWFWLAGAMLSAARIDAEHRIIPDKLTYSGMAAALFFSALLPMGRLAIACPDDMNGGSLLTRRLVKDITLAWPNGLGLRLAAVADCIAGMLFTLVLLGLLYWAGSVILNLRRKKNDTREKQEPMGWGDIKLMMMTSAFLGPDSCIYILAGGAITGIVFGLARYAYRASRPRKILRDFGRSAATPSQDKDDSLPFAPFLAAPALLWMIAGNWLYLLYKMCAA